VERIRPYLRWQSTVVVGCYCFIFSTFTRPNSIVFILCIPWLLNSSSAHRLGLSGKPLLIFFDYQRQGRFALVLILPNALPVRFHNSYSTGIRRRFLPA